MNRRTFLRGAAISAAAAAAQPSLLLKHAGARTRAQRWSDPGTWRGSVPGPGDIVTISKPILLDVDTRVAGINITRGGELIFDPGRSVTLMSSGNVVVEGRLTMRPSARRRVHRLEFVDVDESAFEGGGMDVKPTDVGLWVMGAGRLNLRGAKRSPWKRAKRSLPAGADAIVLKGEPKGWRRGDELVVTPTIGPDRDGYYDAFDEPVVRSVEGNRIRLASGTSFEHPEVQVRPERALGAEVLNLTRNVQIQGTPTGRAHVFIRSTRPQTIEYVAIRYMGPRHADGEFTKKVVGRWGLHFHHNMHDSHGTVVRGVVARDCGAHAFVPHVSHGVTFVGCIAYNCLETPYWWDEPTETDPSNTDDVTYKRCVAARIEFDPPHRGGTGLMGFKMAQGAGSVAKGCVAVGIAGQNSGDSSGFGWVANEVGLWGFEDCVAHNNKNLGTRMWINNPGQHVFRNFSAYNNRIGSFNGAYGNSVDFVDCTYYANRVVGIDAKATSHRKQQKYVRTSIDQAGFSDYCIRFEEHVNDPPRAIVIKDCSFTGHRKAALGFINDTSIPDLVDVVDCSFQGNEFWLGADIDPRSTIRVQDPQRGTLQLKRWDQVQEGTLRPEWNAQVKEINAFA